MNITLKIYKNDDVIKKLENNLEDAFYFKYNHNEVYYISAEFPSNCNICGFIVSSEDHELNVLSNEYTTNLYFGKYLKFYVYTCVTKSRYRPEWCAVCKKKF